MNQDYSLDIMLRKLDTKIKTLETNPNVTGAEVAKTVDFYKNVIKLGNYTQEQLVEFEDRLKVFAPNLSSSTIELEDNEIPKLSEISPKNYKVNKGKMIAAISGSVITIAIASVAGCTARKNNETVEPQAVVENQIEETETKKIEFTEMSKETIEYCDKIVLGINNSISKGFKVTESNKEQMAKKFVNYMNLINMDKLTADEWATYYQDGNITARDIINDYWEIETIFEKIITVSETKEETINFDLFFNKTDAKLLSDAEDMIIKINTSTGAERKNAIKEMHDFIIDTLTITENSMQYSDVALNTFRGVFVNPFDVLSNGNSITDEEEHMIFTVFANCNNIDVNNVKVEDRTINSLQSKFEIYMIDKLEKMLSKETAEEVNPYDSINKMAEYVSNKIDISLYKETRDYVEYQEARFIKDTPKTVTKKSKNDSGVSDGKGGNIANSQFEKYGIDPSSANAKSQLEKAVQEEYEKEAEKNKVHTDLDGTVVDPATRDYWVQEGANDCNKNVFNPDRVPELYKDSYVLGWNAANDAKKSINNDNSISNTYEDVKDQVVESNTTIVEEDYTGDVPSNNVNPQPSETIEEQPYIEDDNTFIEFEPVEEEPETIEETIEYVSEDNSNSEVSETIEEYDYTASIKNLKSLREELLNMSNVYTEEVSKIRC